MTSVYKTNTLNIKKRLDKVSPTICLAKWLWVSLHLPQGLTQSCFHPPTHKIPLDELKNNITALHNTNIKKQYRKMMLDGRRPKECSYCWKIEDSEGDHLSDRYYRSGEWWAEDLLDYVTSKPYDYDINPTYVEVNFNQACNFKCCYCSPHLSTTWEKEIDEFGEYELLNKKGHNNTYWLKQKGIMPIKGDNPYIDTFWEWWPELYKTLRSFRMTGGEPLIDPNTYKILDYINKLPNKKLELSITTNACPPKQKTWNKFINKAKKLIDTNWTIMCIYRYVELSECIICAIIDNEHYFIHDNENILDDEYINDIYNGVKSIQGHEGAEKIKFDGLMTFGELLQEYPIGEPLGNFGELSNEPKTFGDIQIYTITHTYEYCIINKEFYRKNQIEDLNIQDYRDITIHEAKQYGFEFDDDEFWFNTEVGHVKGELNYSFKSVVDSPAIEHLMLFISLDSVGEQLEYSRFGANYDTILNNVHDFLRIDRCISITFINTFNLFSIYKLKEYLEMILDLRKKFNTDRQKVWFDLPILETPQWICINNCGDYEKNIIKDCIKFMKDNIELESDMFKGFKDYEIDKLQRNLDWIDEQKLTEKELKVNKANFYLYFKEYDIRRGTNLLRTFPELESFYKEGYSIYKKTEIKK